MQATKKMERDCEYTIWCMKGCTREAVSWPSGALCGISDVRRSSQHGSRLHDATIGKQENKHHSKTDRCHRPFSKLVHYLLGLRSAARPAKAAHKKSKTENSVA